MVFIVLTTQEDVTLPRLTKLYDRFKCSLFFSRHRHIDTHRILCDPMLLCAAACPDEGRVVKKIVPRACPNFQEQRSKKFNRILEEIDPRIPAEPTCYLIAERISVVPRGRNGEPITGDW